MRHSYSIGLIAVLSLGSFFIASTAEASRRHGRPRISVHGGLFWGYPCHGWGCGYGPPYAAFAYPPPDYSLVDTDVDPEAARVLVDGEDAGTADDYDGFPDYLALSPGRHILEFRAPGYRTLRITLQARRGVLYPIDRKLRPGNGSDADEVAGNNSGSTSSSGPDDREEAANPSRGDDSSSPESRGSEDDESAEEDRESSGPDEEGETDASWLIFRLRPADAAIYLDGKLLGAGETISGPGGIRIEPGRHVLEAVKPGYRPYRTTIVLGEGERRALSIRLVANEEGKPL